MASGVRRIEAIVGEDAFLNVRNEQKKLNKIQQILKSAPDEEVKKIEELLLILDEYPDLKEEELKKILFAISYFCDQNDEIPDAIPDYGYLDDLAVVHWIVQEVKISISNFKSR